MVAPKVLVSPKSTARPTESLMILSFLKYDTTPAQIHVEFRFMGVPCNELEFALVYAAISASTITVVPFCGLFAARFVERPVALLTGCITVKRPFASATSLEVLP